MKEQLLDLGNAIVGLYQKHKVLLSFGSDIGVGIEVFAAANLAGMIVATDMLVGQHDSYFRRMLKLEAYRHKACLYYQSYVSVVVVGESEFVM